MTGLGLLQLILYSPNNDTLERLYLELPGPIVLTIERSRTASLPLHSSNKASGLREGRGHGGTTEFGWMSGHVSAH